MTDRDCEHGQLARSCPICERDEEIAALRKRVEEGEATIETLRKWEANRDARVAELEGVLDTIADQGDGESRYRAKAALQPQDKD